MRLICFWCSLLAAAAAVSAQAQEDGFYAPQTYRNHIESYQKGLFTPAGRNDVTPQSSITEPWRPVQEPSREAWGAPAPISAPLLPKAEPWRQPYISKEQQASIIHHKQALTSEGSFKFEYASDNGLAAGETIEPDGSRVGAYQYKDPSGQIVKLKYRAGKEGFQILEGSHLPKSPEPVAPQSADNHYQQAYEQQRQQFQLQQQFNQQRPEPRPQSWTSQQQYEQPKPAAAGQYYSNWREGQEDDGQYRENEVEAANRGPHNFGEGYAFAFQG
ncbi:uncharacterized protein LOC105392620 [Plutella xylostella]|uniref:uncharacterized protein LOC105392620 n=1 Tax=Plutella xylostella TaxID=51655 RepID=UPI002032DEDB|nr:uncharacterized protein LOC105392620 [Plutella xylostella]